MIGKNIENTCTDVENIRETLNGCIGSCTEKIYID